MPAPPLPRFRRDAGILLVAAGLLFTANFGRLALPPLDDCFYARKAQEMAAHPGWIVTWAGQPTFQNPPGQLWLMAASFRLFGVNDGAARLPTAIMAIGILAGTAWIGSRLLSPAAGVAGAALLAATPLFLNNGRRVMMEIPLLFWTVVALAALFAARRRRGWLFAFAGAIGMAILVKSVLGIVPLLVALVTLVASREWRPLARDPRFWALAFAGVALGASWPLHEWLAHGAAFVGQHFTREIAARSLEPTSALERVLGYPRILLTQFQPVALLAIPGAWWCVRRSRGPEGGASPGADLLLAWAIVPVAFAALSSAQSARYVFPILPALALLGGGWLTERWPRFTSAFSGRVVPAVLLAGAVVLWVRPAWLTRGTRDAYRDHAVAIRARVPAGVAVPFWGDDYWRRANPLLWYADRLLDARPASPAAAVARAELGAGVLLCEHRHLAELPERAREARPLFADDEVVMLELRSGP